MTKLIDANKLFQEIEESMHNSPHSDPTHTAMHKHEHCHFLCEIDKQPEIDPVYFAGGCYCKECLHSEPIEYKFADDWVVPIDEYWCNEHKITMPLNGFCSEGKRIIQRMFKCKHDWQIIHASNVLQQDKMGYPLRLFIQKCSKCSKTEQAWYDADEKCLEEIKAGRFVLCKWEY